MKYYLTIGDFSWNSNHFTEDESSDEYFSSITEFAEYQQGIAEDCTDNTDFVGIKMNEIIRHRLNENKYTIEENGDSLHLKMYFTKEECAVLDILEIVQKFYRED